MINWLLFFPDEEWWTVILRFSLVTLISLLSLFVALYAFINTIDCPGSIGVNF